MVAALASSASSTSAGLLRTLSGHSGSVRGVAVTPDGLRAISASGDHTLKVWELETGLLIATFHCDAPAFAAPAPMTIAS